MNTAHSPSASKSLLTVFLSTLLAIVVPLAAFPAVASAQPDDPAMPSDPAAASDSGSIGIRLVDVPAELEHDPRAHRYIIDHLPPGSTITRNVRVTNSTDEPRTIDVYAGPAELRDGAFVPAVRGEESLLTSWMSLEHPTVDLGPGESAEVAVTIDVPDDAPEFEQYGAIWASHAAGDEDGVTQVSRVGVRVYLSTGEGNGPPSDFTVDELRPIRDALGTVAVAALVTNIGGRAVDISGTLDLTDGPAGLSAGQVAAEFTTIAPGETGEVLFFLENGTDLPPGPWTAEAELDSGVFSHEITDEVTFPDAEPVAESRMVWPWILGGVLAVLALAALLWFLVRRRTAGPQSVA